MLCNVDEKSPKCRILPRWWVNTKSIDWLNCPSGDNTEGVSLSKRRIPKGKS